MKGKGDQPVESVRTSISETNVDVSGAAQGEQEDPFLTMHIGTSNSA